MIYLPDVNVWIALAADKHVHHNVAKHWFMNIQADRVLFCRITQLGFLRLLTNRHVMGEEVLIPRRRVASIWCSTSRPANRLPE
jgi:uncharacterized protein